jgi:hypothetical protein
MRKTTVFICLLALALTFSQRATAQDSDTTPKAQESAKSPEPPAHFYHLDLLLQQVGPDGKPTNSRTFAIIISTDRRDASTNTEIRTGARVPIQTGGTNTQYQYQDVGINFDARNAREAGGKLTFYLAADVSSVAAPKDPAVAAPPVMEQNKWQGNVLVPIGKATTVFSSDDIQSKGGMQLVVTAALLQ